jgi:dTDP-4-dehydrorhamnose 3,5-epimerase
MQVHFTELPGVLLLEPRVHGDARGHFYEAWNQRAFDAAVRRRVEFVQDNHSLSVKGVLRGLHYQLPSPQGKLVRVTRGEIWDVAVDLRRGSPTFGRWTGEVLSGTNRRQLWIPEGFAHGFVTLSDEAEVLYKVTAYWRADADRCVRWDDPELAIAWPLAGAAPILSAKDAAGAALRETRCFEPADLPGATS